MNDIKTKIMDRIAELDDNELLQLWNDFSDDNYDPDAYIYPYGTAASYAEEMSDGDAEIAFATLDRLYEAGEPYAGEYIQEGIYTKIGALREIIDAADLEDLADWIERKKHGDFADLFKDDDEDEGRSRQ